MCPLYTLGNIIIDLCVSFLLQSEKSKIKKCFNIERINLIERKAELYSKCWNYSQGDIFLIFREVALSRIYHLANKVGQKCPCFFQCSSQIYTAISWIHMFANSDFIGKTQKFLFANSKMFTVILFGGSSKFKKCEYFESDAKKSY